ncbi:MAG: hypothetical protein DRJ96_03715 [Thermoprotei archaeon]|nr:MAG: hypothetical protein DRJ67_03370 [Thermoprotei archaeon]RLE97508.1 MAG: hypothetical protein DRJ96_03715 [Thermoprotei archaeon]
MAAAPASTLWAVAWRRFKRNKLSLAGLAITVWLVVTAILAPYIAPYDPNKMHWGKEYMPPCPEFPLGTDEMGRDVLSRVIWGARTSLYVGFASVLLIAAIGVTVGAISGYFGGWIDEVLMRITDIVLTIPTIMLLILIASIFQVRSLNVIILAIGAVSWPTIARITRSQFLLIKELPYIDAARVAGLSHPRIIFRHILPNALPPIIVAATFDMASAILMEASLSFLGLGDPRVVSWGQMLSVGHTVMLHAWWVGTFPGLAIFVTVLGFNLLGDGLREALDVAMR